MISGDLRSLLYCDFKLVTAVKLCSAVAGIASVPAGMGPAGSVSFFRRQDEVSWAGALGLALPVCFLLLSVLPS